MKTNQAILMKMTIPQALERIMCLEESIIRLIKNDPELKEAIVRISKSAELAATVPPEAGAANNRNDEIALKLERILPNIAVNWQVGDCNIVYGTIKDCIAQLRAMR